MARYYECPKLKPRIKSMPKGALFLLTCELTGEEPTARDCVCCNEKVDSDE